jgi:purine nucleoside phosphorylase
MSELCALIAGSGFARLGLEVLTRSPTKTPYGEPSTPVLTVRIGAARVACIVRHGEGHVFAPHEINYRANLWALHQRGIRTVIGINTVGAIAPGLKPGELAVPDQLIDYTSGRAATFGGAGTKVVHPEFTEPFSAVLRGRIAAAIADCGYAPYAGTYGVTQGPRLETAAEIGRMERDGCAMVGMTAMPEAILARELKIDYAICAVAVNYAAGRAPEAGSIDTQIHKYMAAGLERLATVLGRLFDRSGPWAL